MRGCWLVFFVALWAVSTVAQITIETPSQLIQCVSTTISWTGGISPFRVNLNDTHANFVETIASVGNFSTPWQVNRPEGSSLVLIVTDATGDSSVSGPYTIQASLDSSCLESQTAAANTRPSASTLSPNSSARITSTIGGNATIPTPGPQTLAQNHALGGLAVIFAVLFFVVIALMTTVVCMRRRKKQKSISGRTFRQFWPALHSISRTSLVAPVPFIINTTPSRPYSFSVQPTSAYSPSRGESPIAQDPVRAVQTPLAPTAPLFILTGWSSAGAPAPFHSRTPLSPSPSSVMTPLPTYNSLRLPRPGSPIAGGVRPPPYRMQEKRF